MIFALQRQRPETKRMQALVNQIGGASDDASFDRCPVFHRYNCGGRRFQVPRTDAPVRDIT
jgi:hypothetical protein